MGDTSCVCESFQFAECRTRVNAMMVYPTSDGRLNPVQTLFGRYTYALDNLTSHGNKRARRTTAAVYHLMSPPVRLLHPALLTATARAAIRGFGTPVERPAALPSSVVRG